MKVRASEKLFELWKKLGLEVGQFGALVQNDMEISESDLAVWRDRLDDVQADIRRAVKETLEHVRRWMGELV